MIFSSCLHVDVHITFISDFIIMSTCCYVGIVNQALKSLSRLQYVD